MPSRFFSLIALVCFLPALHAQSHSETPAKFQVYGGYSLLSNSLNGVPGSHHPLNGFDASIAFNSWHRFRFKIDTSGYVGSNLGSPQHPYFLLGGAQYTIHIRKEAIFLEGLGGTGGASKSWPANGAIGQTASFAGLAGGGLDTPITRRIAFRVSGGYQYSYFTFTRPLTVIPYSIPGLPTKFGRISTGFVWQF
jgi:hypothetical protein